MVFKPSVIECSPDVGGLTTTEELRNEIEEIKNEVEMREHARRNGYQVVRTRSGEAPPMGARPVQTGEGTLKYENGDTYRGEIVNNMRHGKGDHVCANGEVYSGDWRFDLRDGRGKMTYPTNLVYDGEWKQDKARGTGTCRYPDGSIYEGEWLDDQRCGWGKLQVPARPSATKSAQVTGAADESDPFVECYEGEWKNNVPDGKGRYVYTDGATFEGEYVAGKRVRGKFTSRTEPECEYDGSWENDERHGFGTYFERGALKYAGDWKCGKKDGRGRATFADGVSYDGEWRDDKMEGQGRWTFGMETYVGAFRESKRCGKGLCDYEDASRYEGQWLKDQRHGQGKWISASGDVYEGEWKQDKREGKGECQYHNGDKYSGEWKADMRHGHGVCIFADGTKYRGEWTQDKWIQSSADPEFSKCQGRGLEGAVAGMKAHFAIEACDENQQRRLCGGDAFYCTVEPSPGNASVDAAPISAHVTDKGDGTYAVEYTVLTSGEYDIYVTIGEDELVAAAPYKVVVKPNKPDPKSCTIEGKGLTLGTVGQECVFTIVARDAYGNRCCRAESGGDMMNVQVAITSAQGVILPRLGAMTDAGVIRCAYVPERCGFFRVEVTSTPSSSSVAKGATIFMGESPYSLRITSPASAEENGKTDAETVEKVPDVISKWHAIAESEYKAIDGADDGWDSDKEREEREETKEEKYIREHPEVAVVDNLEDMWKVGRYQAEKKALEKQKKERRLIELKKKLEASGFKRVPVEGKDKEKASEA